MFKWLKRLFGKKEKIPERIEKYCKPEDAPKRGEITNQEELKKIMDEIEDE